jgi:hypothetical protein
MDVGQLSRVLEKEFLSMTMVTWLGVSEKTYAMELRHFGEGFGSDPGVYVFCKQESEGSWMPIYVGECSDFDECLNRNLASHPKWDAIKGNGATNVCVFRVDGAQDRRRAFGNDLRRSLKPLCNRHKIPLEA